MTDAQREQLEAEALWTKRDVATFLGLKSTRSVERLNIPRVDLPARGRKPIVRYDPAEVRAWVEKKKTRSLLKTA